MCICADLCSALEEAIKRELDGSRVSGAEMHATMRSIYTWPDVAHRTEGVYITVMQQRPTGSTFADRVKR